MKTFKRIAVIILVFSLLICNLTGCKKAQRENNSNTAATSSVGGNNNSSESNSDSDTADNSEIPIDDIEDLEPDPEYNIDDPELDPGYNNDEPVEPYLPVVPDNTDTDDTDIYEPDVDDIDFENSYDSPIKLYGSSVEKGSSVRNIDIKTDKVVHKDWLSTGGNIFPGLMSETGMEYTGMNWAFFEIERKRFTSAKPRLNRMFLPVDYMITNENTTANPNKDKENWENGVYDFNSDRMTAVYEYIEMVDNYGGDILLDYGWKADKRIESWFSLSDTNPSGSAPSDLKSFSKACAAAVNQLVNVKGYKNIKYLSFFNEMGHEGHDFDTLGDRKVYYLSMMKMIKNELQKLRLYDGIDMYFLKSQPNYWPVEAEIFVGETEEEVMNNDAKPVSTFSSAPKNGEYHINTVPMLARYLRISFKKLNPALKGIYETINTAFTEICINGTAVKGMQRSDDNDALFTFSDKDTGICWDIVRTDKNDIFTAVNSSKLFKYEANIYEKSSLKMSPCYKIIDNTLYSIEFYDVTGKKVTDLKGREVRIKMPIKASQADGAANFAVSQNRKSLTLIESDYTVVKNKNYIVSKQTNVSDFIFAKTVMTTKNDKYWNDIPDYTDLVNDEPSSPDDPYNPDNTNEPTNDNDNENENINVKTGDTGIPTAIIALFIGSLGLCCIMRKHNNSKQKD